MTYAHKQTRPYVWMAVSISGEILILMLMRSKETEKAIADLTAFLEPRHPSSVLQFITSTIVGWTHLDPENIHVERDWSRYLDLLRARLDYRLTFVAPLPHASIREGRKVLPIPPMVYEGKKEKETVARLGRMPREDALDFMVEVTTNWCFVIPINFLPLVPDVPLEKSDKAIADTIYTWLLRYVDLWH